MIPKFAELVPAFGRDYRNAAEVRRDWVAGMDFFLPSVSRYCSIRDKREGPIFIRFNQSTKLCKVA